MRKQQEINTGSMADIAFLLLVFFLVTTNIVEDKGIKTTISKPFEAPDSLYIVQSTLLVDNEGAYMLNGERLKGSELGDKMSLAFDKREKVKNVLLVKSKRDLEYYAFIQALDRSKVAFKTFYDDLSQTKFDKYYNELSDSEKATLKELHPVALAEDVIY
jgi:biopolymer transport protein ExbD